MLDSNDKFEFFCVEVDGKHPLDFAEIYHNDHPVILEIGSGKGEFISVYSQFYPQDNFLGIELKQKRIVTILKKLSIEKNHNVRLLRQYIDDKITQIIPKDSISEIIINHPDPWPKRKHHKNRLIQHQFIDAVNSILQMGGKLRISTDDPDYRKWICKIFDKRKDFTSLYAGGYTMIIPEDHLWTYFDDLHSKEGFEPAFMLYKKTEDI